MNNEQPQTHENFQDSNGKVLKRIKKSSKKSFNKIMDGMGIEVDCEISDKDRSKGIPKANSSRPIILEQEVANCDITSSKEKVKENLKCATNLNKFSDELDFDCKKDIASKETSDDNKMKTKKSKNNLDCEGNFESIENEIDAFATGKKNKKERKELKLVAEDSISEKKGTDMSRKIRKEKRKFQNSEEVFSGYMEPSLPEMHEEMVPAKKKKKNVQSDLSVESNCKEGKSLDSEFFEDTTLKKKKKRNLKSCCSSEVGVDVAEERANDESIDAPLLSKSPKEKKSKYSYCDKDSVNKIEQREVVTQDKSPLQEKKKLKKKVHLSYEQLDDIPQITFSKHMKRKLKLGENPIVLKGNSEVDNAPEASLSQEGKVNKLWKEMNRESKRLSERSSSHFKHSVKERKQEPKQTWREKCEMMNPDEIAKWQPMVFQFHNHPVVRHYIPRKLMALNGIQQQLNVMDSVELKVPQVVFNGSSLHRIPGYGYEIC